MHSELYPSLFGGTSDKLYLVKRASKSRHFRDHAPEVVSISTIAPIGGMMSAMATLASPQKITFPKRAAWACATS